MKEINKVNNSTKKENYFVISILFLIVILLSIPVLITNVNNIVLGDDFGYHLSRIDSLAYDLKLKNFPVKVHSLFFNGYGYGTGLFYPNFFLYIPAIFEILGIKLNLAYRFFMVIFITFFTIVTYISFKYINNNNKYAAVSSTLFYVFSSSTILHMYRRFALGETLAMAFIPLIICGIYDFVYKNFQKPYFMLFGFLGLIFSHTITLSTCLIIVFLAVGFDVFKICKNKENNMCDFFCKLKKLIIVGLVALSLSACYWMPMLEQFASCKMQVSIPKYSVPDCILPIKSFLNFSFDNIYRISIFLVFCLFARLLQLISQKSKYQEQIDNYLIIGIIFFLTNTKLFPWKYVEHIFYYIQFPWRLLTYVTIYLSLGVGNFLILYLKNVKHKILILYILLLPTIIYNTINLIFVYKNSVDVSNIINNVCNNNDCIPWGVGMEWLPLEVDINLLDNPYEALTSNNEHIIVAKKGVKTIFDYSGNCEYIDIPLIYYKGYTAKYINLDGTCKNLKVVKSSNNGLVRVLLSEEEVKGKIIVDYTGTFIQHFSYFISVISLLVMLYYCKKQKKKSLNTYD